MRPCRGARHAACVPAPHLQRPRLRLLLRLHRQHGVALDPGAARLDVPMGLAPSRDDFIALLLAAEQRHAQLAVLRVFSAGREAAGARAQ
jgi:hypothetical protein